MRSIRSLHVLLCAGLGAFALAACSGGGNPDGSTGDGSHGDASDGTVMLADGNVVDVTNPTGTWTAATSGTTEDIRTVWGAGANDVYAVSSRTLLHSTGSAWTATPSMYVLSSVAGSSATDVWVLGITIPPNGSGEMGALVFQHGSDGNFMDSMPAITPTLGVLNFGAANNGWSVGINGTAAHYDGSMWAFASMGIPTTESLSSVFTIGATDAVTVGERVYRWDGTMWTAQPQVRTDQDHVWYAVWASGPNDIWVVGQLAYIQHWNGTTWEDSDPGNDASGGVLSVNLYGVWGAAPNDVWAVGEGGTIIHFNGAQWSLFAGGGGMGPTTRTLHGVWGSSANDVWAVGDNGTILHYH
jgi:hypothetical protein